MNAVERRGACPALASPMQTGDGWLVRLNTVDGGLSPRSLIGLADAALRHGNGVMEVTARGSLQIRGLTEASALALGADVDALAIAVRTGVPVETGPMAGLDPEAIADPSPLAARIRAGIEQRGLREQLGPKVSVVVDGGGQWTLDTFAADVRLAAELGAGGVRWRVSVADDGDDATLVGVLAENDAVDATLAILAAIANLGVEARARDLALASLDNFRTSSPTTPPSVLSDISPTRGEIGRHEGCRALPNFDTLAMPSKSVISPRVGEMPGRAEGGATEREPFKRNSPNGIGGVSPLLDGRHALSIAVSFGSASAEAFIALASTAASLGATEFRLASQRTLLVLGPPMMASGAIRAAAKTLGFITDALDPRLRISACSGAPACASGHIASRTIADEIAQACGDVLDPSLTLHVSGCAKGCARPSPSAITLVGGENGVGCVVAGTARNVPAAYTRRDQAARGFSRVADLLRGERREAETFSACLARLGEARVAATFGQG